MLKAKIDEKSQSVLVNVKCSNEEWQEAQEQSKKEIAKTLKIPGFRVGSKIPAHVLEKNIDRSKVFNKAIQKMINKYSEESDSAAKEIKKTYFAQPGVNVIKFSETELEFEFSYPFLPEIKEFNLDEIKTKFDLPKFKPSMVDEEIDKFLIKLSVTELTKEPAKLTDHVLIDFKGFIDDEPFEGGEADKYELVLGSNQFIAGFEDQLLGKKAGWKGDIKVTFPENYFVKEYRNKDCVFEIFIHEIKRHNIPKLDVTMIPMFGIPNVETIPQLRAKLEYIVKSKLLGQAKSDFVKALVGDVSKKNEINLNDQILAPKIKELNDQFNEQLKKNDVKRSEYLELTKTTEEEAMEQLTETAREEFRNSLIYSKLIDQNKFVPQPEDLAKYYQVLSKQYRMPVEQVKTYIKESDVINKLQEDSLVEAMIKRFDAEGFKHYSKVLAELDKADEEEEKAEQERAKAEVKEETKKPVSKKASEKKEESKKPAVKKESAAKPKVASSKEKETTKKASKTPAKK